MNLNFFVFFPMISSFLLFQFLFFSLFNHKILVALIFWPLSCLVFHNCLHHLIALLFFINF